MDVTKPYKFTRFGDIHGPKPYKLIGFHGALISQTPVWKRIPATSPASNEVFLFGGHPAEIDGKEPREHIAKPEEKVLICFS
jgi:hypothetical protein